MLKDLINDLRSTTKPIKKQAIIEDNNSEFLKYILIATFEPFKKFHVKIKAKDIPQPGEYSIDENHIQERVRELLTYCENSNSNKKNRAVASVVLAMLDEGSQNLVVGILNKSWKSGLSHKTVAKVFPGLVNSFEVQLANSYLKVIKKKTYKPKDRLCSYKLDGVRCVFLRLHEGNDYEHGTWKAFSRQGKEFLTVDHLKPQLEEIWQMNGMSFWDGELYISGAEFEIIQGEVMRFTQGTSYDLEYRAFICGDAEVFLQQTDIGTSFKVVIEDHVKHPLAPKIIAEKQWLITEDEIQDELEKAFELGLEGIMLRDPEKLYDYKRSDALLKLKESASDNSQEQVADCLVTDIIIGSFPVIINETIIYKQLLVKLIVEQEDGKICKVGSGFSLAFREEVTANPELVLHKVIEAKFQGYGSKGLMRFPRLFRVREDLTWENNYGRS